MVKKANRDKVIEYVKDYYEKLEGPEWWQEVERYLRTNYGYPKVYKPPEDMLRDFHPVFRPLIRSIVPPSSETSMTRIVVMRGRSTLLKARVPPHYIGILDPAFMSRSRNNFGVLGMVPDEKGSFIFSRATLNVPYFWREKIKRLVLGAYGLAKHGRSIEELPDFPSGGVFLLNPDRDPDFDRLTPYNDYHYVTLNVRLPKNYREYIQTLDGSVLISRSAAEKLRYRKVAYVEVMNPVPELRERYLLFKKKGIKVGAEVHFQEPLSIARIGKQELAVNTSPVEGYIYDFKLVTPKIENEARKVYHLTLVGERPAELGCKLESAGGLKHTVAGYVDDREPVIVINPDALKDRSIYWEIKETGKVHVYVTIPGKDGNISNKNARISNTLIQGIFLYPEKVRRKIIEEVFTPENIVINVPENILDIIEDFDIDPEKYPVFYPQLYYVRRIEKKTKDGETKVYYNEQLSQFGRAVEALYKEVGKILRGTPLSALPKSLRRKVIDKAYDRLPSFYKQALDQWVKNMAARLIIGDPGKSCQIKIRGWMRITLFDGDIGVNEIKMSPELWESMGKPEYVFWAKEPVTRKESIRCLKVVVDKKLKGHDQVVYIHPYLGMDYDTGEMHAKVDSVMPYTPLLIKEHDNYRITSIEGLFNEFRDHAFTRPDGKEEIQLPFDRELYVYTDKGWTRIYKIIRHKTTKKIFRIMSQNSVVDVTEDHSLVINGKEISPKDLTVGNKIETYTPPLPEMYNIDPDIAWLYGFFLAEGNASLQRKYTKDGKTAHTPYTVRIANSNLGLLNRAKIGLSKLGFKTKIYERKPRKPGYKILYELYVVGKRKQAAQLFVSKFYDTAGNKTIPPEILLGSKETKKAFLDGFYAGDGTKDPGWYDYIITNTSQNILSGLKMILESLGYTTTINDHPSKKNAFRILAFKSHGNHRDRRIIKKLYSWKYNGYVYDLETENHHFTGGIGNILLHNTDGDLSILIPIKECIKELQYPVKKKKFKTVEELLKKYRKFEDLPEPEYNYTIPELVKELTCFNRYLTQEAQVIELFGGVKNRAMYTDIIKDINAWNELCKTYDIELRAMQAEKYNPELKEMDYCGKAEFMAGLVAEGRKALHRLPPRDPFAEEWLKLSSEISFKERYRIREMIKALKKQKHPVLQLYRKIYENSPLKI